MSEKKISIHTFAMFERESDGVQCAGCERTTLRKNGAMSVYYVFNSRGNRGSEAGRIRKYSSYSFISLADPAPMLCSQSANSIVPPRRAVSNGVRSSHGGNQFKSAP